MKTLVLCSNTAIEASMRFRVLQFVKPMQQAGHQVEISSFFDEQPGSWPARVARGFARRALDIGRAHQVDRLLVHREIFPLSLNQYVSALPKRVPLIFDFDDAVFLRAGGGWRSRIAQPESTRLLVERADVVFAGNEVLAEYARQFGTRVLVVPTVVDTDRFVPVVKAERKIPVVGWVGSPSASRYLEEIVPALEEVGKALPFTLRLVGAGRNFSLKNVQVENLPWRLEEEVSAFQDLDVGLYPLADDAWSRGKCGFKAIQYMACGVPFVVTPVGAIKDIVRDGTDGLWAVRPGDWAGRLLTLLQEEATRKKLIAEARKRVVAHYSVQSLAPSWVKSLEFPHPASGERVRERGTLS